MGIVRGKSFGVCVCGGGGGLLQSFINLTCKVETFAIIFHGADNTKIVFHKSYSCLFCVIVRIFLIFLYFHKQTNISHHLDAISRFNDFRQSLKVREHKVLGP
jgi:hypothetical protein